MIKSSFRLILYMQHMYGYRPTQCMSPLCRVVSK